MAYSLVRPPDPVLGIELTGRVGFIGVGSRRSLIFPDEAGFFHHNPF
jgi:hypothetical protein